MPSALCDRKSVELGFKTLELDSYGPSVCYMFSGKYFDLSKLQFLGGKMRAFWA